MITDPGPDAGRPRPAAWPHRRRSVGRTPPRAPPSGARSPGGAWGRPTGVTRPLWGWPGRRWGVRARRPVTRTPAD